MCGLASRTEGEFGAPVHGCRCARDGVFRLRTLVWLGLGLAVKLRRGEAMSWDAGLRLQSIKVRFGMSDSTGQVNGATLKSGQPDGTLDPTEQMPVLGLARLKLQRCIT